MGWSAKRCRQEICTWIHLCSACDGSQNAAWQVCVFLPIEGLFCAVSWWGFYHGGAFTWTLSLIYIIKLKIQFTRTYTSLTWIQYTAYMYTQLVARSTVSRCVVGSSPTCATEHFGFPPSAPWLGNQRPWFVQPCLCNWAYKRSRATYRKREGDCLPVVGFLLVSFIK